MAFNSLFAARASDGSSAAAPWPGGLVWFFGSGTFGSGTLTFQISVDGGTTWFDIGSITAKGALLALLPECSLRATLAGATNPELDAGWKGGARSA